MLFSILVFGLAVSAAIWTLVPFIRHSAWWIRVFDFPRIQIALVLCVTLPILLWRNELLGVAGVAIFCVLVLCLVYQASRIIPYSPLYPKQVPQASQLDPQNRIRLLIANVLMTNRDEDRLLKAIQHHDPDIALLLETDKRWDGALTLLDRSYGYAVKHPRDNLYGMHLFSKYALQNPKVLFRIEKDVPSIQTDVVLPSGNAVELHCLHPAPPSPTENQTSDERDAELLLVAKSVAENNKSVIVMGDLNDVGWSHTTRLFQKIGNLLDPRIGRGMFCTFHASIPFFRFPLDHVFCSSDFKIHNMQRLGPVGSDHFPILADLCVAPRDRGHIPVPDASAVEHREAEEKIIAAKEKQ